MQTHGSEPPAHEPAPGTDQPPIGEAAPRSPAEALAGPSALRAGSLTPGSMLALQRSAGNAAVARLLREAAAGANAPATLLVDDAVEPAAGQMRNGEFLEGLQTALFDAAEVAFALTPYRSEACPWIEHWIGVYRQRDAAATEAAVRRFAPDAAAATTAQAYVAPLATALQMRVATWLVTGELGDVPAEAGAGGEAPGPAAEPSSAPAGGAPAEGGSVARTAAEPAALQAELGPGRPLDGAVRSGIGARLAGDLDDVRVHTDTTAARAAARVGARAFAVGRHIAFGAGEYEPGTPLGDALMAHELAHVLQHDPRAPAGQLGAATLEADAHTAAVTALGGRTAQRSVLRTGLQLQRCGSPKPPTPDAFVTELLKKARAGDKAGFFADLRGQNGARAGDAMVRYYLDALRKEGKLTEGDAFRAVALQELGPEPGWASVVKNFADGVDGGQFRVGSGLAPAGADALRQFSVERAGAAAEGGLSATGAAVASPDIVKRDYRIRFDARWDSSRFSALKTEFDPHLDSKGPRSPRARVIFNELYTTEPSLRQMYDANSGGVREFCDLYAGPEAANIIASPRLQDVRAMLDGPAIPATGTGDPAYTAFVATILPKAQALDANDRQEIQRSRRWRTAIEAKVHGPTSAVTLQLAQNLRDTIVNAQAPAPPGPAPGPAPAPPAPVAPLAPSAAEKAWLGGITIKAPAGPIVSNKSAESLTFAIDSKVPNPGLAAMRRITIEPADKVLSGQEDETPWPAGTNALPHTAQVSANAGAAGHTEFEAHLTMVPLVAGAFPEQKAKVRVEDHRLAWFTTNVDSLIEFTQANSFRLWSPGDKISYHGGQVPMRFTAKLPASNPGITMFVKATLTKDGAPEATFGPLPFGSTERTLLGTKNILSGAPPPAAAHALELTLEFFPTAAMVAPAAKTVVTPFAIDPQPAAVAGGDDATLLASDKALLNQPKATAGSLRHHLGTFPAGSVEQRVLAGVESGAIKVDACVVRSDSAAYITGPPARGNPAKDVAYGCGGLDDAHTLVGQPNAIGWHRPSFNDIVYLNATPDPQNPGAKRGIPELANLLVHEGIHAADQKQTNTWERYQKEFRAYWVQGVGGGLSSEYKADIPETIGPRSPRANHLFQRLYYSATYDWVKPAYDGNVAGFRDRADAYLWPDMVNPLLAGHLADLRSEIESYTGAAYPAKKVAVATKFAVCDAAEKEAVAGNRVWRDLVETKFTGSVVTGLMSREKESDQIKRILGIPL